MCLVFICYNMLFIIFVKFKIYFEMVKLNLKSKNKIKHNKNEKNNS